MTKGAQEQTVGAIVKGLMVLAIIIAIVGFAVCIIINMLCNSVANLLAALSSLDVAIVVALITGCVSIVTVIGGGIANSYLAYRQRRNECLRGHREQAYQKLIEIVYKIAYEVKKEEPYGADEVLNDMNEFNQSLTLWGSSHVALQILRFVWGEYVARHVFIELNHRRASRDHEVDRRVRTHQLVVVGETALRRRGHVGVGAGAFL